MKCTCKFNNCVCSVTSVLTGITKLPKFKEKDHRVNFPYTLALAFIESNLQFRQDTAEQARG